MQAHDKCGAIEPFIMQANGEIRGYLTSAEYYSKKANDELKTGNFRDSFQYIKLAKKCLEWAKEWMVELNRKDK